MSTIAIIFLLLVVYQLKHFVADYLLQGEYMLGKFKPGWDFLGPLCAHVAVHGVWTYLIAAFFLSFFVPIPFAWALLLGVGDAFVHFFMDRIKASPSYMGRWKPMTGSQWVHAKVDSQRDVNDEHFDRPSLYCPYWFPEEAHLALDGNRNFWRALGFDQLVHHLTHYALIYALLRVAGLL